MSSAGLRVRDLAGRRVVVWGFGVEGRAAARLLLHHARPSDLIVVADAAPDQRATKAGNELGELGEFADLRVVTSADVDFATVDVIVKSPGVSPYVGAFADVVAANEVAVTSGTALWFAETGGARTVGVTGSKGKSTTSTLTAALLEAVGRPATLAGNVGRAMLDVLDDELRGPSTSTGATGDRWYVVETSSFQAHDVTVSPQVGVLTALFPEHLDWHGSVERYYADKCNLFAHGGLAAVAVNTDNADAAALAATLTHARPYGSAGALHPVGTAIVDTHGRVVVDAAGSKLRGRHNLINLAGALTALSIAGVDLAAASDAIHRAVHAFEPLEHRLEPVGDVGGRLVIDDSLSTAPEAAVAALAAFAGRPVGIIVGGHDRGLDYTSLAVALASRTVPTWVHTVPTSGARLAELFQRALAGSGASPLVTVRSFEGDTGFDDAVLALPAVVPPGGVLLLSPAAPSFGRFPDYAARGRHFRALLGL